MASYRPDEPYLGHSHHGAKDAETKGNDGGDARGEEARGVVDGDVVAGPAALEQEVLG